MYIQNPRLTTTIRQNPTLGIALLERNPLAKPEVNLTNRTYQETEAREISIHWFMSM
jgi:hypothetical protein